ncbi:M61 family metallopeptidase [Salinimonas marina]|uniref:M61 family metallopeptidase n=1 Tax=Salinimonas marina TaxID=2785918 RepID=A0A7S9HBL5_9ALTE|nr:PDZ domain-containing protein [Salinimonas marina]QPG04311.1 M61 family metallopeptidase [Salinimonas marina]
MTQSSVAQPCTTPHYTLAIDSVSDHTFAVSVCVPARSKPVTTLTLPAWIPGSYMIRDFARHIIKINAVRESGEAVPLEKCDKQTWQYHCPNQTVIINYTVFAFDLSVRSAYINDQYAFCNGTSVFLQIQGLENAPLTLSVDKPPTAAWQIHTSMPQDDNPTPAEQRLQTASPNNGHTPGQWHYCCESYAELIDHPLFIGIAQSQCFTVDGIEFEVLFSGDAPVDIERICQDLKPICQHHLSLFEKPYPIERYVFMTLLSDTGFGGLEHRSSTALLYPRFDLPLPNEHSTRPDGYITFLSLCSHELFHTWNVKRIRPQVLIQPDLQREVFTEQLWIYEGFTSFYDDLTLARTGLISADKYLEIVGQNLTRLLHGGGRHVQSAAASSFDAWTRFYKQDASSVNHIVSYYTKGGIIAMGLDLLIRRQSDNQYSLDTVMKHLWNDYGKDEQGTPDDVIATLCKDKLNIDVGDYLDRVVYGTEDVDLSQWLDDIGVCLQYRTKLNSADKGGTNVGNNGHPHLLGATVKTAPMGVAVVQVNTDTPASEAGLHINDVLLAVDNFVVNENLLQRLLNTTTQAQIRLTVVRDGRLLELSLPVREASLQACYFTIEDRQKLQHWLGLDQ